MKLKRYDPDAEGTMDESETGQYVRFEDVEYLINTAIYNQEKNSECQSCDNNDAIFTTLNNAIGDES